MSIKNYRLVSDWLALADGRLQIRTGKVDIGQRISTSLVGIVQQELTLAPEQIEVLAVRTGDSPDEGMTSGSNSIEQSGHALRVAAATLRTRLVALAASRTGSAPEKWSVEDGKLCGPNANRPLPLLDLAGEIDLSFPMSEDAPSLPVASSVALPMRGLSDLVKGKYRFIHDLDLPGMLHARVVRPPHAKASLRVVDEHVSERLEMDGFRLIRDGSFLAVTGAREWQTVCAAQRLASGCDWDPGKGLDETDIFRELRQGNAIRLTLEEGVPRECASVPPPLAGPSHTARYERPFTMHGALAPSAAMAAWDGHRLEITTHSQGIYVLRESIAESLRLASDLVRLTFMPGSGCYGHNAADDAAFEAALVAMAVPKTPILLKWSREDEHAWEPFGPAGAVELAASVDADGRLLEFSAEAISGTFRGRPRAGPNRAGPAKLLANHFREAPVGPQPAAPNLNLQGGIHRNLDPVYEIEATRCVKNLIPEVPFRTSALRCLGAALNVFAIESFVDEIARSRNLDPIALRKAHLSDPRALAVLDRLEARIADNPAPSGAGRGIAYAQYKNAMTRVGIVVDLEVGDAGGIRLRDVVLVADAGRIVDRDGLAAQLEGGALQAASWALHEEVVWDRDGVISRDWESYPVLRFSNVPRFDMVLLDQPDARSLGAGEASPGPMLAAVANAVFDATGLRLRRLPFTPQALTAAALAS